MELLNYEKLLNSILYFSKNVNYFGKTKLYKLLFNVDFMHFKETGFSITGLNYFAWEKGPVPYTLYNKLKNDKLPEEFKDYIKIVKMGKNKIIHKILPKSEPDMSVFSKREKIILKKVAEYFKNYRANKVSEISHLKGKPWERTRKHKGGSKKIDYILSIDSSPESISKEEAIEKQNMVEEMYFCFK